MKVLDRYITRELVGPFAFGVAIFLSVFVAGNIVLRIMRVAAEYHPSALQVLKYFLFSLPEYIVLSFPMSVLLAVLLGFGRLSGEAETVAMRTGGVSFQRLMAPVVLLAVGVSLLTIVFNEGVVPRANRASEDLYAQMIGASEQAVQDHPVVKEVRGGRLVSITYARRLYPKRGLMEDATYVGYRDGRPEFIVFGRRAVWEGRTWKFSDGLIQYVSSLDKATVVIPKGQDFAVEFRVSPSEMARRQRSPEEMTWRELRDRIAVLMERGVRDSKLYELQVQWHHRLSVPFSCLIFALIGAPLGVRSHRSSASFGLGLAVLIVFVYYVIWHYLAVAAEQGSVNPLAAAWAPNLVGAAVGAALIARVSRWGH